MSKETKLDRVVDRLLSLIYVVRVEHRNPESANYRNCEDDQCPWCEDVQQALDKLDETDI